LRRGYFTFRVKFWRTIGSLKTGTKNNTLKFTPYSRRHKRPVLFASRSGCDLGPSEGGQAS